MSGLPGSEVLLRILFALGGVHFALDGIFFSSCKGFSVSTLF
jgi:hypothetical protein